MLWSALLFCSTPLRYWYFPVYRTSLLFLLQSKKYSFCPSVERGKMVWYSFLELIPKSSSRSWICFLFSGPTHQLFWFKMITMMWDETIYLKNCEVVEKVKISKSNMIQKLESKMNVNITGWGGNDFLYLRLRFWRKCSVVWSLSGVEDHLDPFIILIHSHSHSCWDEPCISWRRNVCWFKQQQQQWQIPSSSHMDAFLQLQYSGHKCFFAVTYPGWHHVSITASAVLPHSFLPLRLMFQSTGEALKPCFVTLYECSIASLPQQNASNWTHGAV